jgi:flagellum-specific peptidoglycan hydrolase FlgJ
MLESGEGRRKLMQEYNIGSSTLYDIKAHKEQLLEFATDSEISK